jgi:hypothetical protein
MAHQRELGRSNALQHELLSTLSTTSAASPEHVYDLLADLPSHLIWGGERQNGPRLVSMDAPEGPATVGTEFTTEGADRAGTFRDISVVTEARRPELFGFVTEARLTTKRGVADWTVVHRYEIASLGAGCSIRYSLRVVRISELPGPLRVFNVAGLRALAHRFAEQGPKRGLRNLARLAEERAVSSP